MDMDTVDRCLEKRLQNNIFQDLQKSVLPETNSSTTSGQDGLPLKQCQNKSYTKPTFNMEGVRCFSVFTSRQNVN